MATGSMATTTAANRKHAFQARFCLCGRRLAAQSSPTLVVHITNTCSHATCPPLSSPAARGGFRAPFSNLKHPERRRQPQHQQTATDPRAPARPWPTTPPWPGPGQAPFAWAPTTTEPAWEATAAPLLATRSLYFSSGGVTRPLFILWRGRGPFPGLTDPTLSAFGPLLCTPRVSRGRRLLPLLFIYLSSLYVRSGMKNVGNL